MSRRVRVHRCSCRVEVLRGDCELGIESLVDPAGLSLTGLAIATLTGRRVFDLVFTFHDGWVLRGCLPSKVENWLGRPAVLPDVLIMAEHVCRVPLSSNGHDARADMESSSRFSPRKPPDPAEPLDPAEALAIDFGLGPDPIPPPF